MTKWQYLWRPSPGEDLADFSARARELVPRQLRGLGAREVWLHVTEEPPPWLTLVPLRRIALALVSLQGDDPGLGDAAGDKLDDLDGQWSGYRVTEAQPVARARTWPLGERAPGACLLTVFRKNPRLDRERFLAEWHGKHTPMSLEIHPLESYVRNTVEAPVILGSPPWDGIVTESFASRRVLLNPLELFGGPLRAPLHMARVGLHIRKFMDLRTMQNYLVAEYPLEA
jgi:hypothetical protein